MIWLATVMAVILIVIGIANLILLKRVLRNLVRLNWDLIKPDLKTMESYLGPREEWKAVPPEQLPRLFRERGWCLKDEDDIWGVCRKIRSGVLHRTTKPDL